MSEHGFDELVEIMARLRGPNGCPWDREQTHDSLSRHVIEEAYELVEAIEHKDDKHLKEELGDLLLQIVFHAQIAADRNAFTIDEVVAGLNEKLERRHPHIFAEAEATTPAEVSRVWEEIKREDEGKYKESRLEGIPGSLPALLRAGKVQKRMVAAGFDWEADEDVLAALTDEAGELGQALRGEGDMREEIGDILFMLVNVARRLGIEPEAALRAATSKAENRFRFMEREAERKGQKLEDMTLEEQNRLWEEAKNAEDS